MSVSFKNLKPRWSWIVLGLVILLVVMVRVRLREMPLERDEGEYAYAGQLLLEGVPPYKEAYNMKLPGTYAAYAVIMAVFGQTPSGIHVGLMLVNIASIVLVYLIGRRFLDEVAGVVAAVSFTLLSLSPSVLGLAAHATHFVTFFALAGIYVLLLGTDKGSPKSEVRSPKSENSRSGAGNRGMDVHPVAQLSILNPKLFLSGILLGLAFLMKQHGIFFGIFAGLYLLWLFLERWLAAREEAKRAPLLVPAARQAIGLAAGPSRSSGPQPSAPSPRPAARRLSHFAAGKRRESPKSEVGGQRSEVGGRRSEVVGQRSEVVHAEAQGVPSLAVQRSRLEVGRFRSTPVFSLLLLILGFALPYVLTCLVLWIAGVFPQFWFWTVSYAAKYAAVLPLARAPELLRAGLQTVVGPGLVFWILPWAGALFMWWDERLAVSRRVLLMLLLFCSFGSASIGLYYREHYFITVLPVLSLLSGLAISRALSVVKHKKDLELIVALAALLLLPIAVGACLVGDSSAWFAQRPEEASKNTYHTGIFAAAPKVAEYLRANASKNARVAVLGSEPEIYFHSGHRAAAGHLYMYPLMEAQPFARTMQEQMIAEIERARPEYVVYVEDPVSWLRQPETEPRIFEWWEQYKKNLELVQSIRFETGQVETEFRGKARGTSTGRFLVYRKRS